MSPLKSVLLVDDNSDDNTIHSIWLRRSGAVSSSEDILIKENGLEALEFLKQWEENQRALGERFPPSLILLDINMPVMDGFAFLEELEKLSSTLDISSIVLLMLTSSNSQRDQDRASRFSLVKGYIQKPLNRAKIQRFLREHFPEHADAS